MTRRFSPSAITRVLAGAACLLALAGCERTAFQSPPSDSTRCDRGLIGQWVSVDEKTQHDGELVVVVGDDCNLRVQRSESVPHAAAGTVADAGPVSEPTALRSDRVGNSRYLWLDAAWAQRNFDIVAGPLDVPGDVYVFSYATDGREGLTLHGVRHRALAHRILDKDINGEVLAREDALTLRVRGDIDQTATLLRKFLLFDQKNGLRFRRADGTTATR